MQEAQVEEDFPLIPTSMHTDLEIRNTTYTALGHPISSSQIDSMDPIIWIIIIKANYVVS